MRSSGNPHRTRWILAISAAGVVALSGLAVAQVRSDDAAPMATAVNSPSPTAKPELGRSPTPTATGTPSPAPVRVAAPSVPAAPTPTPAPPTPTPTPTSPLPPAPSPTQPAAPQPPPPAQPPAPEPPPPPPPAPGSPPAHAYDVGYNPHHEFADQCTWYAAERMFRATGKYMPAYGDAWKWPTTLRGTGWTVGTKPALRSVAMFPKGAFNSVYGHVGWVIGIDGNRLRLLDYNWNGRAGQVTDHWVTTPPGTSFVYSDR